MSTALAKSMDQGRAMVNMFYSEGLRLKASGGLGSMLTPSIAGDSFFAGFRDQAKSRESYGAFRNWLYSAINALAMEGAAQPITIARMNGKATEGEKRTPGGSKAYQLSKMPRSIRTKAAAQEYEVLIDHPLLDVMDHPNEMQHRWQFIYSFIANLNLTGWSYIVFDVDKDGKLRMYSIPTTWVRVDHKDGPFSKFYIINPHDPGSMQNQTPLTRDNVAFAYLPDPANPLGAIAPATSQMPAIRIDDYIQFSQQQHFQNGIFPSVIVTVGKDPHPDVPGGIRPRLSGAQRRQVTAAINKAMGGVANYGSPAIVDGLIESINKFSQGAPEMGWAQSEEKVRTRILSAFAVHPYILGEPVGVGGYAQVANIEKRFYKRVNSFLDMLSTLLTGVVEGLGDGGLMVWIEECQVVDPSLRQSALQFSRSNGDISQNEWRAELGLPPDEDRNEAVLSGAGATIVAALLPVLAQGGMKVDQMQAVLIAMGLPDDVAAGIAGPELEPQAGPAAQDGAAAPGDAKQGSRVALNGIQITAAMGIVASVLSGEISRDMGINSLMVMLNLTREDAELIIGDAKVKPGKPPTEEQAAADATAELKKAIDLLKAPPEMFADLILPMVRFDKGDLPGHPFRGNQWDGGSGSGSGTSVKDSLARIERADSPAWKAEKEAGYAITADGNVMEIAGGYDFVDIDPADRPKFKDAVFTHNHPIGLSRTMSGGDVAWARWADVAEMRAFGTDDKSNRWVAVVKRPSGGWPKKKNSVDFDIAYNNANAKERKYWVPRIKKGEISLEDAMHRSREKVHSDMAKKFGFVYERKSL